MKQLTPIGAACTLADLAFWIEETNPEVIFIPINHTLRHIREFNPGHEYSWTSYRGIPINYEGDNLVKGRL